jgi:hypothetical protein
MPLIVDPDDLAQGVEVTFDTAAKTIALNSAGDLATVTSQADGVTLKCLYSFCKEEWKNDATLIPFEFPFVPITDESYELVDGWDFANDATRYLIRNAGWAVKNTSGNVTQQWAGIIGLGSIESNDQLYFDQSQGRTNTQLTGQVNQAVQILDDPNGDGVYTDGFDYRAQFDLYVREQAQIYGKADLADIGVTGNMSPIAYRFPLGTATDLKVSATDNTIDTTAPYTGMSIEYFATPQARNIGGTSYNFGIIINGNNGTAEQIYEFVQRQLRQTIDIDAGAGSQIGNIADELLLFVGNDLETLNATNAAGGGTGVYIDNFQAADTNRISFRDNTEPTTPVSFPFVAVTTISFNPNLQNDTDAIYRVFFTDLPGALDYGTANAVLVHTNDEQEATDISFTAPDLIDTAGAVTFTDAFAVGEFIHVVTTSGTNDGYYEIATISGTQIELVEQTISTETAGTAGTTTLSQTAMGTVGGNASIQFDFAYNSNTQGGRTSSTDADITVVAIGLQTGQYVSATGTIGESTQNSVSLVAPLERNYDNPV